MKPESLTTHGITVKVETMFISDQSSIEKKIFTFAYRISITNHTDDTIKLLRRKWIITDALGGKKIIEGEGVLGVQPVLSPGESHTYVSGTHFPTLIGKMEGTYTMLRYEELIDVKIPVFVMETPGILN